MCLAEVYLTDGQHTGTGELVLADVAYIESEQDGLLVSTMLGETKVVSGEIVSVDFMRNTVTLRPREGTKNA